jgi:hypothetical protein
MQERPTLHTFCKSARKCSNFDTHLCKACERNMDNPELKDNFKPKGEST